MSCRKNILFIYWSKMCPSKICPLKICPSKKRPGAVRRYMESRTIPTYDKQAFFVKQQLEMRPCYKNELSYQVSSDVTSVTRWTFTNNGNLKRSTINYQCRLKISPRHLINPYKIAQDFKKLHNLVTLYAVWPGTKQVPSLGTIEVS